MCIYVSVTSCEMLELLLTMTCSHYYSGATNIAHTYKARLHKILPIVVLWRFARYVTCCYNYCIVVAIGTMTSLDC